VKALPDNRFASVSGIVVRDSKILLVRQAYGAAKGLLVIPGGYLSEGEMPNVALEREILEETGVVAVTESLIAIRFSWRDWWAIFTAKYISGEPVSDNDENSEVMFLDLYDALPRDDLSTTTKEVLKTYNEKRNLVLSNFYPDGADPINYKLYL